MLLEPLSYHIKVRDYFKRQSGIWSFFSAARKKEEQLTAFKTDLLKNTYQFQAGSDPLLYEKINIIRERLGLGDLSVTVYQAAHSPELNASIVCLPGEAHMVFSGGILQLLGERELLALIGHELAHVKLYSLLDGELEIADRIITALAGSPDSEASHYETARLFRLYTEIYCDRVACEALGEAGPVITMLLKMATGLPTVHAESYIRQAEEIFAGEATVQSAALTHPENFIRTRALHLWGQEKAGSDERGAGSGGQEEAGRGELRAVSGGEEEAVSDERRTMRDGEAGRPLDKKGWLGAEEAITRMIEGVMELDRLDVLAQKELTDLTRELLTGYLRPEWFQTPMVVALARQYFPDIKLEKIPGTDGQKSGGMNRAKKAGTITGTEDGPAGGSNLEKAGNMREPGLRKGGEMTEPAQEKLKAFLGGAHLSIREYFAYVLLDLALADPDLEDVPLEHAFQLAETLGIKAIFEPIVKKETSGNAHR